MWEPDTSTTRAYAIPRRAVRAKGWPTPNHIGLAEAATQILFFTGDLYVVIHIKEHEVFEREGENHAYFLRFAPPGYAFGVNTLLYSMTH